MWDMTTLIILGLLLVAVVALATYRIHRDGWHRPHRGGTMDAGQAGRYKGYWHAG